jgi:hypothetical protein
MAKATGTTTAGLYLNRSGGTVYIGTGGLSSNGHCLPGSNNSYNLGSSSYNWKELHVRSITSGATLSLTSGSDAPIVFSPEGVEQGRFNTDGYLELKAGGANTATIIGPNSTDSNFYFPNTGGTFVTHAARGTAVGSSSHPVYIAASGRATGVSVISTSYGGTGVSAHTANRLVWSTSATSIQGCNHYASSSKIGVNLTSEPSYNFYVNGTSYFADTTIIANGKQLRREGYSSSWYNGRDYAMIRQTTINGYSPILSVKSTNGTWEMGCYDNSSYIDRLIIGYKDDSEYSAGTPNSIVQAFNLTKTGYLYLASGCSMGSTLTFTNATATNNKITTNSGAMYYASASTTYIDSGSGSSIIFRQGGTEAGRFSTDGTFYVTTAARPSASGGATLGTSSYYWGTAYLGTVYSYSLLPRASNSYNLGSTSYYWGTAYLGSVYSYSLYPRTSNSYNLGSTSYIWATGYMHRLYLCGTTDATMTGASTNPRITFAENASTQPVHLIYTDYNDYRSPAGLKVVGDGSTGSSSPAWFEVEGAVYAEKFYASSDRRLKTNLQPWCAPEDILQLPLYSFDFIHGDKNNIGCIAQDLQQICPEIVYTNPDGYLAIEENKIVYLLLDKMKKMQKEIEELKEVCSNGK